MLHRLSALAIVLAILGSVFAVPLPSEAARPTSQSVLANAPIPPDDTTIAQTLDCSNSPFGRVLTLGAEREVYVGYRGSNAHVLYDRLDLNAAEALVRAGGVATQSEAILQSANQVAATWADVNGDGEVELVQVFNDSTGAMRTLTHFADGSTVLRQFPYSNYTQTQVATLTRGANTVDRVVVAARTNAGSLRVVFIDPIGEVVTNIFTTNTNYAEAQPNQNLNFSNLRLAAGDFDADGSTDDIAVAFIQNENVGQLLVLTRALVGQSGSGSSFISDMRLVAFSEFGIGTPQSIALTVGDLNGDYRDEIIYGQEDDSLDSNISSSIDLRGFTVDMDPESTTPIAQRLNATFTLDQSAASTDLVLAAGDTDRDGRDELVRAYRIYGDNSGLLIESFDGEQPGQLIQRSSYRESSGFRSNFSNLALDIADMDGDARDDIVAAMRDAGNQLNVLRLSDAETPGPDATMTATGELRDGSGARTNLSAISVDIADYDNDSIKAHYEAAAGSSLICRRIVEPQITAAVFTPPYWEAIQADQERFGTIGESRSVGQSQETSVTSTQGHSVSGFFGVGIEGAVAEFNARVTAGYSYESSVTNGTASSRTETIQVSNSNAEGDFVLIENATYNCYNYQVQQTGQDLDGSVRFCQYQSRTRESPSLDSWDIQNGPVGSPRSSQWAPIARDWTNLGLFRLTPAIQSSTAGDAVATRANDSIVANQPSDSQLSRTNSEQSPWWQIDLDEVQTIGKVRVWGRDNRICSENCPPPLQDFYVFVSDVDPRTISNDPAVLSADPRVRSFRVDGPVVPVANVLTIDNELEEISGRFVRVQLIDEGALELSEVQVFGTNHVDPDRYPIGVFDPDATVGSTGRITQQGTDGWFMVRMFDPRSGRIEDVRTRGNLVWNGSDSRINALGDIAVGPGASLPSWSLTNDVEQAQVTGTSVTNSASVGVEFEVSAGLFVRASVGGGYEFSRGITEDAVRTTSIGSSFEIGGGVAGFPTEVNGRRVIWPTQCTYGFQPYYYEISDSSSVGYSQRFLVVDYVVPASAPERSANLDPCRLDRSEPTFESNEFNGAPGSNFVLTAQGFVAGETARISMRGPGSSTFQEVVSLTMSSAGSLVFVLVVPEDAQAGTYQVRLETFPAGQAQLAQSTVRDITLQIEGDAPLRTETPPEEVPVVNTPAFGRIVYLPMLFR